MTNSNYLRGLTETGNGIYSYLQPDGSWGWSNSGLVFDSGESLLIDTLFDAPLTREMLKQIKKAVGINGSDINSVVNTHANGDHTHGNGLCPNAEIIASDASSKEMNAFGPEQLRILMQNTDQLGETGNYLKQIFGSFDFGDVAERLPTRTFTGEYNLEVGRKKVTLKEVGPAHTRGDVLVFVDGNEAVYTGDILFIEGTPIMWAGPVSNWIRACDMIIDTSPQVIVPGHGPMTDTQGVKRVRSYLEYIHTEARTRFDAGMTVKETANDIALSDFSSWTDAERIIVNVDTLFKEYSGSSATTDTLELFSLMAEFKKNHGKK
ncbi:MAG: MBL fold metallo-hydrolase [Gammaproteobacteria bacterium]|nr:MBL fold metallo-hydrolase [Gammaproteobacteria bacterium]